MRLSLAKFVSLCVLVLGIGAQLLLYAAPAPVVIDAAHPEDVLGRLASGSSDSFTVDISSMRRHLNRLRVDERPEQLADWAIYASLMQAKLAPEVLSKALYDKVPYRLPSLEETANFDYGAGRRAMLPDGVVWLLIEKHDPHPEATLARLADQVRMEIGQPPTRFSIFHYDADLVSGKLRVSRQQDIPGAALFSSQHGYVEKTVHSLSELGTWLSEIDDVTHIKMVAGGLELGGRRLAGARTLGASMDDVAALYQAHQGIAKNHEEIGQIIAAKARPAIDGFNELVHAYNGSANPLRGGFRFNQRRLSELGPSLPETEDSFTEKLHTLGRILGRRLSPGFDRKRTVEALRESVDRYVEEVQKQSQIELYRDGRIMPSEPGFSLDPQWNVAGLIADLNLLLTQPDRIVQRALSLARESASKHYDEDATPVLVQNARFIAKSFGAYSGTFHLAPKWQQRISRIVQSVAGKAPREAEEGALVPFLELKEELQQIEPGMRGALDASKLPSGSITIDQLITMFSDPAYQNARQLHGLLAFLEAQHRMQCARYDGPMQGTKAAMNLFYTDLLAKLWLGVDYYRSAPAKEVPGFQSLPRIGGKIEPSYWREMEQLTATRIWFGVKPEASARSQGGDELNFAHIATRVYSAGSNPLAPGKETLPAEGSRRALGWWDRHYAQIADYEQQYHLQNQIMKWSMITGWMVEKNLISDLSWAPVDRKQRFDEWYKSHEELKFKHDVRLLAPQRWVGDTECMEILKSYRYEATGGLHSISGGVSLGGLKAVKGAPEISETIAPIMRRGGLDYGASKLGELKTWKGTSFKLPEETPGKVLMSAGEKARLRNGPSELKVGKFETEFLRGQSSDGRIALRTDQGSVVELKFTATQDGMRMDLETGALVDDQSLMVRMAEAGPSSRALAADPALQAQKGRFLIETEQGPELLITDARGGGGGVPPRSRVLRFAAEEPDSGAYAFSSGQVLEHARTQTARRLVEAIALDEDKAAERLNELKWQRIAAGPDGRGQPRVLYSARGPKPNAQAVHIDTGNPLLGILEGFLESDGLVLKRPEAAPPAAQTAWNDFARDSGFSGQDLARLRMQVRLSPAGKEVQFSLPGSRSPGEKAAAAFFGGNPQSALAELGKADEKGNLADALKSMEDAARNLRRDTVKGKTTGGSGVGSGEDANVVFTLGHEPAPGPNLGEAHDVRYLPVDERDFYGPQIERADDASKSQIKKEPSPPDPPTGPRPPQSRQPPSGPPQPSSILAQQARVAMCADLNDDGELDRYELDICRACEKTRSDLNGDGVVDASEERTCSKP